MIALWWQMRRQLRIDLWCAGVWCGTVWPPGAGPWWPQVLQGTACNNVQRRDLAGLEALVRTVSPRRNGVARSVDTTGKQQGPRWRQLYATARCVPKGSYRDLLLNQFTSCTPG